MKFYHKTFMAHLNYNNCKNVNPFNANREFLLLLLHYASVACGVINVLVLKVLHMTLCLSLCHHFSFLTFTYWTFDVPSDVPFPVCEPESLSFFFFSSPSPSSQSEPKKFTQFYTFAGVRRTKLFLWQTLSKMKKNCEKIRFHEMGTFLLRHLISP